MEEVLGMQPALAAEHLAWLKAEWTAAAGSLLRHSGLLFFARK
jgi:hypothetical protein